MHQVTLRTGALAAPRLAAPAARLGRLAAGVLLVTVVAAALAVAVGFAAGVRPHVEASDSMRPALRSGDVVWLDGIVAADARVGDVVAFAHPDDRRPVLHRVARIEPAGADLRFVTRGDANSGVERWSVRREARLGRYTGVRVPAAGRAARSPQTAAAVVAVAVALLLRRIWR